MSIARAETETEKVSTVKMLERRMFSILPKLGLAKKRARVHSLEENIIPYDESRFGKLPSLLLSAKEKDMSERRM